MGVRLVTATTRVDPLLRRGARTPGGSVPSVVGAPISLPTVWKAVALLTGLAALVTAVVVTRPEATTAVDVRPASVWLSGEARGRIVLAGARSERPSLAVQLGDDPSSEDGASVPAVEYDVAEGGGAVFVHDRVVGSVQVLDGRDGSEVATVDAPVVTGARAQIVGAGIAAYLVDPTAKALWRLDPDGTLGEQTVVDEGFTDWAGAADGLLWLVNDADGSYANFDGEALNRTASFADPGTDLTLTVVGVEPVVLDPSTSRLRWIRQNTSFELGAPDALLQDPDPAAACAAVLAADVLSCVTPDGPVRQVTVATAPASLTGAQLIANGTDAVITRAGDPAVTIVDWTDGSARGETRAAPSQRRTVGTTVTGTIVVDDPGSQFAFSVDRGGYVVLDKFSKRTIIIGEDGTSAQGVGQIDENADVAGVFTDEADETAQLDDNGVNDPPRANDDEVVTRVGRSINFDPLANDVDPEDDPLSIVQLDPLDPTDGTATTLNGARVAYTPPEASDDRFVTFGYTVADAGGLESSATIRVEVIGSDRNTAPDVADDRAQTNVGVSIDIPVLDNDTDAEGDPLTIIKVGEPEHGTAAIGNDGTLRYEPAADYLGADEFTYRVADGYGEEAEATVRVTTVEPTIADRPPVARDDRAATSAGVRVRIEALGNDIDPDGDPITIVAVQPLNGVDISIVGGRAIDVLPSTAMSGLLTFSYTIADDDGLEDAARVSLWVEAVDAAAPPVAVDDNVTTAGVPVPIDVVANDVDPNGGQLTVDAWGQPAGGEGSVARLNPTTLQFTPTPGIQGTVQFTYTVRNAANLTAQATVTVTVTPPTGSGPVASDDSKQIFPGEVATIAPLANDSHPDGLPIDFAGPPVVRAGRAVVNADRTITFTPPNQSLATYRLTYTIQDANLRRSTATITITVVARPVTDRPPIAVNDVQQTQAGTAVSIDVLANDEDPDGDSIRIESFTQPASGTVALSGGRLVYTPGRTTTGVVTFTYTVVDDTGRTARGTVTVSVAEPVRIAPQAVDDLASMIVGNTTTVNPLANDIDPDGSAGGLSITGISAPSGTGLTAVQQGSSVRLVGNQVGSYTVRYTITDADGLTAVGTISVVVQPVPNTAPNATNDSGTTLPLPFTIDVLSNDSDPDGGVLSLVGVTPVSPSGAGSATVSAGQVVYTPSSSFSGVATFGYTVRDSGGLTDTATVTVTVTACPALPSMTSLTSTTRFNTPVLVPLFTTVPAGNTISVGSVNQGTVVLQGGGTGALYTPPPTFNGTATFAYTARNICNQTASGTVTVTVNRAPTAVADTINTPRNTAVVVPVLANDTDVDQDTPLVVDSVTNGTGGAVTLAAGVVTFTPTSGFVGVATFTYRVRDPGGLVSAAATVRVTVANVAPVAVDDTVSVPTGTSPIAVTPLTNDTDPGDTLVVQSATLAAGSAGTGTLTNTATGVSFVPAPTFTIPAGSASRSVTVNYVVADSNGGPGALTDAGVITITITNRSPVVANETASLDLFTSSSVAVNVLANDSDPDGTPAGLSVDATVTVAPSGAGTVTVSGGLVTYTHGSSTVPAGPVILTYVVRDQNLGTTTGTITITVTNSTPPPTTLPPAGP